MKTIPPVYLHLWEIARPYYKKGRPMDIDHIKWMMDAAWEISQREQLDDTLLLPLCILHDVGYSTVKDVANTNYYDLDVRKVHMEKGARIAESILTEIGYDQEKKEKIVWYVSVHDNWAYGEVDLFVNDPILGTFKDLDYLWIYTQEGCRSIQKVLGKNNVEMLEHLRDEPSPIYGKKPFSNKSTKELHRKYLEERMKDFKAKP